MISNKQRSSSKSNEDKLQENMELINEDVFKDNKKRKTKTIINKYLSYNHPSSLFYSLKTEK